MESELKPSDNNSLETLEDPGTVVESSSKTALDKTTGISQPSNRNKSIPSKHKLKNLTQRFNVYLLGLVLVVVVAIVIIVVSVIANNKTATPSVATQTLTQKQLEQLATSDVSVGTNKQILNVQSNAVFAGQVLIHQDLEVAGTIKVGGSLTLPGIVVSGASSFSQIQTGTLTVSGNTAVQGQLTASGGLNVAGNATFAGTISANQVTISNLTLNGELNLDHHISAGGPTPSRSSGSALGNGGTVSVSGSDTAGTVTINTGTSTSAGCFVTINFTTKFNSTPHAVVTPIGASAGGLAFYATRSTTAMSICTNTAAPASSSFAFDYIVFD